MTEKRAAHLKDRSTEVIQVKEQEKKKKRISEKMNRTFKTFRTILKGLRRLLRQQGIKKPEARRMDLTATGAQGLGGQPWRLWRGSTRFKKY